MTFKKSQTITIDGASGTTIPIDQKFLPYDGSEQLEQVVNDTVSDLINPINNREVTRYEPILFSNIKYNFYLLDTNGVYQVNYDNVIEPLDSKTFLSNRFNKSFFVLDYYSTERTDTQRLVDRTILNTFNGDKESNGGYVSRYTITSNSKPGYTIYPPKEFIQDGTIENDTIYLKARWFNAGTGEVKILKTNPNTVTYTTYDEADLYYEITLNGQGNFYEVQNPTNINGGVEYQIDFYDFVVA